MKACGRRGYSSLRAAQALLCHPSTRVGAGGARALSSEAGSRVWESPSSVGPHGASRRALLALASGGLLGASLWERERLSDAAREAPEAVGALLALSRGLLAELQDAASTAAASQQGASGACRGGCTRACARLERGWRGVRGD
jgi:hypothetical protein